MQSNRPASSLAVVTLAFVLAGAPAATHAVPPGAIDLDAPGAIASLADRQPDHHARAAALIRVVERNECHGKEVARLRVALDIAAFDCALAVMTSDPPKRRVAFTLDGTPYTKVVVLRGARGEFVPLRR